MISSKMMPFTVIKFQNKSIDQNFNMPGEVQKALSVRFIPYVWVHFRGTVKAMLAHVTWSCDIGQHDFSFLCNPRTQTTCAYMAFPHYSPRCDNKTNAR